MGVQVTPIGISVFESTGTLIADGTEQIIVQLLLVVSDFQCYIDLTNLVLGDSVTIRQYMKIKSTGPFLLYADEVYEGGAQVTPLILMPLRPVAYGTQITLQQTAGILRTFDWEVFQDVPV